MGTMVPVGNFFLRPINDAIYGKQPDHGHRTRYSTNTPMAMFGEVGASKSQSPLIGTAGRFLGREWCRKVGQIVPNLMDQHDMVAI